MSNREGIWAIRKHPSLEVLYTVGSDGTLNELDLVTGEVRLRRKVSTSNVWNLVPFWDKNLIFTSSQDSYIQGWDLRSDRRVARFKVDEQLTHLRSHESWCNTLIGGNSEGLVSFWDPRLLVDALDAPKLQTSMSFYPNTIREIALDGSKLIVSTVDKSASIGNMESIFQKPPQQLHLFPDLEANCIALTSTNLICGTRNGEIKNINYSKEGSFAETVENAVKLVSQSIEEDCRLM